MEHKYSFAKDVGEKCSKIEKSLTAAGKKKAQAIRRYKAKKKGNGVKYTLQEIKRRRKNSKTITTTERGRMVEENNGQKEEEKWKSKIVG